MQHGVRVMSRQESAGEDHTVEGNVILAHELIELDVLWVLPPEFPIVLDVVSSNGKVANWSIVPDIEDLLFELFKWDSSTPFEVS